MPDLLAVKVRLYLNKKQREQLDRAFGCCRFLWNQMLTEHREAYNQYKLDGIKTVYKTEKEYKIIFQFLKEVDSIALQATREHLEDAYSRFFKNCKDRKAGKTRRRVGHPRFKRKHGKQSYTTKMANGNIKIDFTARKLKLPKIKSWIKYRDDRAFDEKMRSITVSKTKSGKYYASILIARENIMVPMAEIHEDKIIAFDAGMKDVLVTDEFKLGNPRFFRKSLNKLKKTHRKVSRTSTRSNNHVKACNKLASIYERYINQKNNWMHELSHAFANQHDAVIIEDLNIEGMKQFNKGHAKSITKDISWGEFVTMLGYKLARLGKYLVKVGRFYPSSQLCSSCGHQHHELTLDQREWTCPACGVHHDRDINASINIKREGLRIIREEINITVINSDNTAGTAGINARGDHVNPLPHEVVIDETRIHGL